MYCKHCGQEFLNDAAVVCVKCGCQKGYGVNYCAFCGQPITPETAVCNHCGAANVPPQPEVGDKSKLAAGLLGIFLGGLGIHNFYLKKTARGLIQILVCLIGGIFTCGVASAAMEIWGLVEGIMILTGSIKTDGEGKLLHD